MHPNVCNTFRSLSSMLLLCSVLALTTPISTSASAPERPISSSIVSERCLDCHPIVPKTHAHSAGELHGLHKKHLQNPADCAYCHKTEAATVFSSVSKWNCSGCHDIADGGRTSFDHSNYADPDCIVCHTADTLQRVHEQAKVRVQKQKQTAVQN